MPDRPIPDEWPRAFGMDVGWNRTAVVWGARHPGSGVIYLYSEHYQGQSEPASHAQAIRSRGDWIPGVIDPACLGSSQIDGRTLVDLYSQLGLSRCPAMNAVEAGITVTPVSFLNTECSTDNRDGAEPDRPLDFSVLNLAKFRTEDIPGMAAGHGFQPAPLHSGRHHPESFAAKLTGGAANSGLICTRQVWAVATWAL